MNKDVERALKFMDEYMSSSESFSKMKPKIIHNSEALKVFQDKVKGSRALFYNAMITLRAWGVIGDYDSLEKGYPFFELSYKEFVERWKK